MVGAARVAIAAGPVAMPEAHACARRLLAVRCDVVDPFFNIDATVMSQ